jgi:hypothetical protein
VSPSHSYRVVSARLKGGHRFHIVEENLDGDPSFESGQFGARTNVGVAPEGQVAARVGAGRAGSARMSPAPASGDRPLLVSCWVR